MRNFYKIIFTLSLLLASVNSLACGEDKCPASDCNKKRCMDYINRTGDFVNRPRLRCIDLCHSACSDLLKDELKACSEKDKESEED